MTSSARNASCELPVASITFAAPRASIAARIASAAVGGRVARHRRRRRRRRAPSARRRRTSARAHANCGSQLRGGGEHLVGHLRDVIEVDAARERVEQHRVDTLCRGRRRSRPRPSSPATRRPGAGTRRARPAARPWSRPAQAVAVGGAPSTRRPTSGGRSGHWPAFGRLSGKLRGLSRRNESIIGATISPDGMVGTSVDRRAAWRTRPCSRSTPHLAVRDRRELDAPALAPARLLGEEAGEELDEVAVARAGQHAEALEQRELHLVAGRGGRAW